MKKTARHSKNSLFLMEMVMVLLFLSLSGAACVRIFATARENRIQTQEWIHIQSLTTSIGEIMEGTSGERSRLSSVPAWRSCQCFFHCLVL